MTDRIVPMAAQPRTYPGKRFLLAFGIVLIAVLVVGLWITEFGAGLLRPGLEQKAKERREKEHRELGLARQGKAPEVKSEFGSTR